MQAILLSVSLRIAVCNKDYLLPGTLVTFPLEAGFSRSGVATLVAFSEAIHAWDARTTSQAKMFRKRKMPTTSLVGAIERKIPRVESVVMVYSCTDRLYMDQGILGEDVVYFMDS